MSFLWLISFAWKFNNVIMRCICHRCPFHSVLECKDSKHIATFVAKKYTLNSKALSKESCLKFYLNNQYFPRVCYQQFIIKYRYIARFDWLKWRAVSECRGTLASSHNFQKRFVLKTTRIFWETQKQNTFSYGQQGSLSTSKSQFPCDCCNDVARYSL